MRSHSTADVPNEYMMLCAVTNVFCQNLCQQMWWMWVSCRDGRFEIQPTSLGTPRGLKSAMIFQCPLVTAEMRDDLLGCFKWALSSDTAMDKIYGTLWWNVQFVFSHCLVIVSSCSVGYVYFRTGQNGCSGCFFLVIIGVQDVFLPKDVMARHRWWWQVNSHPELSWALSRPCYTLGRGSFHRPTRQWRCGGASAVGEGAVKGWRDAWMEQVFWCMVKL